MKNYEDRLHGKWPVCKYSRNDNFRRIPLEGARKAMQEFGATKATYGTNIIQLLAFLIKVTFSFWFCVFEFLIESVTNKWLWNVILVIINVSLDVFFHLVLALSAIMVVLILNIDDIYQDVKNEKDENLSTIFDDEQTIDIIEGESCPNLV